METNNREAWSSFDDDLNESNVGVASEQETAVIDEAVELQMISIRLQKGLLASLKAIADFHNVGYQPLIRDLLIRFATAEMKLIVGDMLRRHEAELKRLEDEASRRDTMKPIDEFFARERKQACA